LLNAVFAMAIPSVCYSHALCKKTAECILMLSSLHDSPIILVCQHSIFFPEISKGSIFCTFTKNVQCSDVMFLSFRFVLFEWKQKKTFRKNEIKNVQKQNKTRKNENKITLRGTNGPPYLSDCNYSISDDRRGAL